MKLRLSIPKRKLQATATRRVTQQRAAEEEENEPTMKFSSAFVIVVILHVVAVGGIYAFNSVKAHHPVYEDTEASAKTDRALIVHDQPSASVNAATAQDTAGVQAVTPTAVITAPPAAAKTAEPVKPVDLPRKTSLAISGVKDSGVIHTVVKGENPVSIARRLGVGYDDLLKLNHIDDPKRLQIGQKLHIPVKIKTASN